MYKMFFVNLIACLSITDDKLEFTVKKGYFLDLPINGLLEYSNLRENESVDPALNIEECHTLGSKVRFIHRIETKEKVNERRILFFDESALKSNRKNKYEFSYKVSLSSKTNYYYISSIFDLSKREIEGFTISINSESKEIEGILLLMVNFEMEPVLTKENIEKCEILLKEEKCPLYNKIPNDYIFNILVDKKEAYDLIQMINNVMLPLEEFDLDIFIKIIANVVEELINSGDLKDWINKIKKLKNCDQEHLEFYLVWLLLQDISNILHYANNSEHKFIIQNFSSDKAKVLGIETFLVEVNLENIDDLQLFENFTIKTDTGRSIKPCYKYKEKKKGFIYVSIGELTRLKATKFRIHGESHSRNIDTDYIGIDLN